MFSFFSSSSGGSSSSSGTGGSGKPLTPAEREKEMMKKWQSEIKAQMRDMERQIRGIEREQEKIKRDAKEAAKKGETGVVRSMAKNIVMANKAIERIHITKANLNSVLVTLQTQSAVSRVAGVMQKSTAIMKSMNALIRVPELSSTMRKMGEEMAKAGIIEEMMGEAMDSMEPDGLDAEADEVTEAVLFEITQGMMGSAPTAAKGGLPTGTKAPATAAPAGPARVAVLEGGASAGAGGGDSMDALRDRLDKL